MRFISNYGKLLVQIRPEISEPFASGVVRVLQESIGAQFEPHGLRPHEREAALAYFQFPGGYQELDEATMVPPDYRIGVFDTEMHFWPEEIRREAERVLSHLAEHQSHIMLAPATSVPPPWPRYDEYGGSVASLVRKLEEEGYDLPTVLVYEREAQNRPKLVEALEAAIAGEREVESEEVVVG